MRIGIDVGGTNTDAALLDGGAVLSTAKRPTTGNVTDGLISAIQAVLNQSDAKPSEIRSVMIGTTHFLNAVVQKKGLAKVASLRLCGDATQSLPPMVDWPDDLREAVEGYSAMLPGGLEYDGSEISPLNESALRDACQKISAAGIDAVAVTGVFSLVDPAQERRAKEIIQDELPEACISLSHEIGRLGLLERENATIMNACITHLARDTIAAFHSALSDIGLECPLHLSQNDGTLMSAEKAAQFPVLTFAAGPTNSMRGAAFLSGMEDAIVVDIGGTTSDVGALVSGFPREASVEAVVSGVRTNFRMPDVISVGLGGGSRIRRTGDQVSVGPDSVGHDLLTNARVFGGSVLTATDIAVASGLVEIGDPNQVSGLDLGLIDDAMNGIRRTLEQAIDQIKIVSGDAKVILAGGGAVLVGDRLDGVSEVVRIPHYSSANAVGAAIGQVSGEVDRIVSLEGSSRDEALEMVKNEAIREAIELGAERSTVVVAEVDDTPIAYLPGNVTRFRIKAVGELR